MFANNFGDLQKYWLFFKILANLLIIVYYDNSKISFLLPCSITDLHSVKAEDSWVNFIINSLRELGVDTGESARGCEVQILNAHLS